MSGQKIRHDFASQQEALSFGQSEVGAAQTATDETVTSGKVTQAGLGEDTAGAQELAAKNAVEYQRAVEYQDLASLSNRVDQQANDIQQQTAGQVQQRFSNA